jgi:hypothetical protein
MSNPNVHDLHQQWIQIVSQCPRVCKHTAYFNYGKPLCDDRNTECNHCKSYRNAWFKANLASQKYRAAAMETVHEVTNEEFVKYFGRSDHKLKWEIWDIRYNKQTLCRLLKTKWNSIWFEPIGTRDLSIIDCDEVDASYYIDNDIGIYFSHTTRCEIRIYPR